MADGCHLSDQQIGIFHYGLAADIAIIVVAGLIGALIALTSTMITLKTLMNQG